MPLTLFMFKNNSLCMFLMGIIPPLKKYFLDVDAATAVCLLSVSVMEERSPAV